MRAKFIGAALSSAFLIALPALAIAQDGEEEQANQEEQEPGGGDIYNAETDGRLPRTNQRVQSIEPSLIPAHDIDTATRTVFAGIDECQNLIETNPDFSVEFRSLSLAIGDPSVIEREASFYRLERGSGRNLSCPEADDCNQLGEESIETVDLQTLKVSVPFQTLSGLTNTGVCDEGEVNQAYYLQLRLRDFSLLTAEYFYVEGRVIFDLVRPAAPALRDAMATEDSITVEFERSSSTDVVGHYVLFGTEPFEGGVLPGEATSRGARRIEGASDSEKGTVTISGVEPGQTIYIAVAARDRAGNYSVVSEPIEATVFATVNFWDLYNEAGGAEAGGYGCAFAAGGPGAAASLIGLALVAFGFRRRRGQAMRGE